MAKQEAIHWDLLGQWAKIILLFQTFIKIIGKMKNGKKIYSIKKMFEIREYFWPIGPTYPMYRGNFWRNKNLYIGTFWANGPK